MSEANQLPDFWNETTDVAKARKLRLAVIQNVFDQGLIREEGAREILAGPLTPDDPSTVYDDSQWLNVLRELLAGKPQDSRPGAMGERITQDAFEHHAEELRVLTSKHFERLLSDFIAKIKAHMEADAWAVPMNEYFDSGPLSGASVFNAKQYAIKMLDEAVGAVVEKK